MNTHTAEIPAVAQALAESLSRARFGTPAFAEMLLVDAYDLLTHRDSPGRCGPRVSKKRNVYVAQEDK